MHLGRIDGMLQRTTRRSRTPRSVARAYARGASRLAARSGWAGSAQLHEQARRGGATNGRGREAPRRWAVPRRSGPASCTLYEVFLAGTLSSTSSGGGLSTSGSFGDGGTSGSRDGSSESAIPSIVALRGPRSPESHSGTGDAVPLAVRDAHSGLSLGAMSGARADDQSGTDALTGIIGARRACTVSMISPLSMPCR